MSLLPTRHRTRTFFPELGDLLAGIPTLAEFRRESDAHLIRLEDESADGKYIVRAEMPGIDPDKDVDITVRDGHLSIKAERTEKKESNGRSEFSYGSFVRTIMLPPGADEDAIKASYENGILTVTVAVPPAPADAAEKRIPVEAAH